MLIASLLFLFPVNAARWELQYDYNSPYFNMNSSSYYYQMTFALLNVHTFKKITEVLLLHYMKNSIVHLADIASAAV